MNESGSIYFHALATERAENFLRSGILSSKLVQSLVGTDIHYGEEFLDLFSMLSPNNRAAMFPMLDDSFYRGQWPHLLASDDTLTDYLLNGFDSGASPHPLIDMAYMRFLRPDLECLEKLEFGAFLEILTANMVDPSPFFDLKHYRKSVSGTRVSPSYLFDFLIRSDEAECSPHPLVDIDYYRSRYNDVPAGTAAAFLHFVTVGDAERRVSSPDFDPVWYSEHYAEDDTPLERPLAHYLRHGRFVSRAPRSSEASSTTANGPPIAMLKPTTLDRSAKTILNNYSSLTSRLAKQTQRRLESYVERDIRPVALEDHEAALKDLKFADAKQPQVDILIPCYQEFEMTVECLAAIAQAPPEVSVRIMIIDDCSPDPRYAKFADVPGLTYKRNAENLHFLRSCNSAYAECSAPYALLLNNDAQLAAGTLDRLWAVLDADDGIAAASPMIRYPNGRLQEAGCTINADGDTGMVGVGDDPDLDQYRRDRDIAYGSGACLLVRRDKVGETLFDERFAPAYCEDTDLCIRLRQDGGRIRYVSDAECVHHLSVSTSAMSMRRRVQLVRRNQQKLHEKWGDRLRDGLPVRVLAYYLPQFHPIAENDLWWGKGFTEWTNVTQAQPSYAEHYQPHLPSDLGFYDLRVVETMEDQMRLARRHGVHGFVMYYYNFQGKRLLDRPLRNLIEKGDADFRFCLCWANENWTKHWDGGSQKHALMTQDYGQPTYEAFADDAIEAARLPGAIKVNGVPLLMIYRPLLIPNVVDVCEYLRKRFHEAGLGGVYLAYVESMETANQSRDPRDMGFDASAEFPPQGIAEPLKSKPKPIKPAFSGNLYDYAGTVANACNTNGSAAVRFPGVFPSWDNAPRQPLAHTTLEGALPERFQSYVEAKLDHVHQFLSGDERLLFVNAWNEWAEGAHLEPDQRFEHDWLRAISDSLQNRCFI
jgi:GT2 family glycosyltransferase